MAEKKVLFICSECGEPIREGERYFHFVFGDVCRECVRKAFSRAKAEEIGYYFNW